MQRLPFQLRAYGSDDFGMPVTDVKDAEAAQTIDVLATVDVGEDVPFVGKLDRGIERAARSGLAVLEKSRVHVIAEPLDRFADDPIRLRAIEPRSMDEV